jgi:hypothetical protein
VSVFSWPLTCRIARTPILRASDAYWLVFVAFGVGDEGADDFNGRR